MAQGPNDTILVAIRITLRIRESKVRNQDRWRFVFCECILVINVNGASSFMGQNMPDIFDVHVQEKSSRHNVYCS